MSLELSPTDAAALDLGHRWGQISRTRILRMADQIIENAEGTVSSEICELAVCQKDFQINDTLGKFFNETGLDKWVVLKALLNKFLDISSLDNESCIKLFYSISNYIDWDDPSPWREFKILCHELSDARVGVYGDEAAAITNSMRVMLTGALKG